LKKSIIVLIDFVDKPGIVFVLQLIGIFQIYSTMSYQALKSYLEELQKELTLNNYKEIKLSLIEVQNQIAAGELEPMHRAELRDATQAVFEQIKDLQKQEQQLFEEQANENFEVLRKKVIEAIDFTQKHINDHDAVWQMLIDTQQEFKGRKLLAGQREQLFGTLQKLFDILKKRRGETVKVQGRETGKQFERLEDEVNYLASQCKTADPDKTWASMLQTKDRIMEADILQNYRKKLIDKLQEGFDLLKIRREKRQNEFIQLSTTNADIIKEKLKLAEYELDHNSDFKDKWELLLAVQQEFKNRKLEKETRNILYDQLQALFQKLKSEQYSDPLDFEQQANENLQHLKSQVDIAFDEAQNSMDFKKAKAFLIKVQADFKGRKMRSFEREKLFARLQNAFGILGKRMAGQTDSPPKTGEN
jgi:hypothetical protein